MRKSGLNDPDGKGLNDTEQKKDATKTENGYNPNPCVAPASSSTELRDFLTVLALSFHAVFEGLAVGLEKHTGDVWTLFTGNA